MPDDLLGVGDAARAFGWKVETVRQWKYRGVMPAPDATVSGRPAWRRSTLKSWAQRTERMKGEQ